MKILREELESNNLESYILKDLQDLKKDQKEILKEIASIKTKLAIVSSFFGVIGSIITIFLKNILGE